LKVLFLGGDDRSGLATVRSLAKEKCKVDFFGLSQHSVVSHSKYVEKHYFLNTDKVDELRFHILELLSNGKYDLVLPGDDVFCHLLDSDIDAYERFAKVSLPGKRLFKVLSDKQLLINVSNKLKILTPETKIINKGSQVNDFPVSKITFPVYAKPRYSVLIYQGKIQTTCVKKLHNSEQLLKYLSDYMGRVDVLLQNSVPGFGKSAYIFAVEGKVISISCQTRLHEPENGGGSSYRSSSKVDSYMLDSSIRIVSHYGWTGPIMIEYKYDPESNKYYIMEINARLWGSLALTINSGHNIPKYIYEYFSRGIVPKPNKPIAGLTQRHLINDIGWLYRKKKGVLEYFLWIGSFKRIFYGKEFLDVEKKEDFMPAIWSYFYFLKHKLNQINRITGILLSSISFLYIFQVKNKKRLIKVFKEKKVNNILFVCRGNIARSAYCENWAKNHILNCNFLSAGTLGLEGRYAHPEILNIVANDNFHSHSSVALSSIKKDWPDLIFIMDAKNLYEIKSFDFYSNLIFPLSCLSTLNQIKDPDKMDLKKIPETISIIENNLRQLEKFF
jgi:predicted ATP-grasp superfamily ATP-dependent carboligase/protein-tyrosine-phosphatase